MNELPQGWAETTLGAIGDYWNGRGFKKSEWRPAGQGRQIIRIQDLTGSHQDPNYFDGTADERNIARKGDILVSWAATLGIFEWPGPEAVINQHIFKVESFIDRRFHRYLIESVLDDLRRRSHGTGMVHVTRKVFDETPVILPPLLEQGRIVAAIEEQFSRLDTAEQLLRSALRRRDVLYRSFMRTLEEWPLVPLSALLEQPLANGRSVPTAENGSGFPVLRLTALRDGFVDLSERKLGAWGRREAERYIVQEGDFLIARGNGSLALVGRGGLVTADPDGVAYPDTMIRARVDQKHISPEFLRWVWSSSTVRRQLESAAKTTAGIYKVNQQDLGGVAVPVPPPEVQGAIVEDLGRQQSVLDALTRSIHQALARSSQLRRSILEHAFAGKLVPQDPDDEPAPEQLERIAPDHRTSTTRRRRQRA